ncbi:hypothetical protein Forpe1208_v002188 [Fusarium oxysporum f. sp. rapae]|uniref:Uncharacterized protein n=1 Tax=Fusarium oxysporum f. sp. rapae TaxID=485398 RepID=A0A8J5PAZ9_FUSOX|nr:hypothetical protein Forpe1208_v002188 [Fusarium oxysporum f. sp. rapae]
MIDPPKLLAYTAETAQLPATFGLRTPNPPPTWYIYNTPPSSFDPLPSFLSHPFHHHVILQTWSFITNGQNQTDSKTINTHTADYYP